MLPPDARLLLTRKHVEGFTCVHCTRGDFACRLSNRKQAATVTCFVNSRTCISRYKSDSHLKFTRLCCVAVWRRQELSKHDLTGLRKALPVSETTSSFFGIGNKSEVVSIIVCNTPIEACWDSGTQDDKKIKVLYPSAAVPWRADPWPALQQAIHLPSMDIYCTTYLKNDQQSSHSESFVFSKSAAVNHDYSGLFGSQMSLEDMTFIKGGDTRLKQLQDLQ